MSNKDYNAIKFGRWLLKYSTPTWSEGLLCWLYQNKLYDTEEIYKIFLNQNL